MNKTLKPTLPLRHLSVRVPWHDAGWNGTVCKSPRLNTSCLKLKHIAASRNDALEQKFAGKSLLEIDQSQWPCCVKERSMFMAPFQFDITVTHPYVERQPDTHGHLAPTPLPSPAYAAPAVPFSWMMRANAEKLAREYDLDVDLGREPKLTFEPNWVEDLSNQQPLLDCFWEHIRPEKSLCFFYAKQTPFAEEGRIILGVGRVKHVAGPVEYRHSTPGDARALVWERMVQHSIRPGFADGFLLPYHAALEKALVDPSFDPADVAAFAPTDRITEFFYGSEHVTNDGALSALLSCTAALEKAKPHLPGPWDACQQWIDARLAELWKMRGPCPGLGAALSAFGIDMGTFIAYQLEAKLGENEDPWPLVHQMFLAPEQHLPSSLASKIGKTLRETWTNMPDERKALLQLISRFEITPVHAKCLFVKQVRETAGIPCTDRELRENPYLVYELTRNHPDPVSLRTVDAGVFPEAVIRQKHPLPEPSALDAGTDARRVRALTVELLERAAMGGSTLLPQDRLIRQIRDLSLQPPCEVHEDLYTTAEKSFEGAIQLAEMADGTRAYQLHHLADMGTLIQRAVTRRIAGARHTVHADWRKLLDEHLIAPIENDETEEKARQEKAAALKELAEARLSVLIGPAGTGKTTLLSVLCGHPDIAAGNILPLAPTGKARVRLEEAVGNHGLKAFTLAQFLYQHHRYDAFTQRYHLSPQPAEDVAATVIVDEASMLTEEMLAAVLEALKGVKRLILVGDPRQLPPIGAGRPFVDIVSRLTPNNIASAFPHIGTGYAELTIRRRQAGQEREDLQLAEWFSGRPLGPGEDEIFDAVVKTGESPHVRFVQWDTAEEFDAKLMETLAEELKLEGVDDNRGFDLTLGGVLFGEHVYFNPGNAKAVDAWQILSPHRAKTFGIEGINRLVHRRMKSKTVDMARLPWRKIMKPLGAEEIVYGDKVINVTNHRHAGKGKVYPVEGAAGYIANGEIGIAVGQYKKKNSNYSGLPWNLEIEFSSQPHFKYLFDAARFGDEGQPPLELAYALTVHRAQGSEFGLVLLVLPNPCPLLSRELLYTALTRQQDRVVILHQGNRGDLKQFASDARSDTATRLTNLFEKPRMVEIEGRYLEDRLINRTRDGLPVRSKSEVIIYDQLVANGIAPSYEKELKIGGATKLPDFTIEDDESGVIYYWEHLGMLNDPGYRKRWEKKLQWYRDNAILPIDEGGGSRGTLIITTDTPQGGISSEEINQIISKYFLN